MTRYRMCIVCKEVQTKNSLHIWRLRKIQPGFHEVETTLSCTNARFPFLAIASRAFFNQAGLSHDSAGQLQFTAVLKVAL